MNPNPSAMEISLQESADKFHAASPESQIAAVAFCVFMIVVMIAMFRNRRDQDSGCKLLPGFRLWASVALMALVPACVALGYGLAGFADVVASVSPVVSIPFGICAMLIAQFGSATSIGMGIAIAVFLSPGSLVEVSEGSADLFRRFFGNRQQMENVI